MGSNSELEVTGKVLVFLLVFHRLFSFLLDFGLLELQVGIGGHRSVVGRFYKGMVEIEGVL